MMRVPLLERNPDMGQVTLPLLVGVASAIEREAVARYAALAETMERRGETEVAEAFRRMLDEERKHVDAVEQWAHSLGQEIPDPVQFSWRLPPELFRSWDEVARSARLTPYRAFAIAVDNEQRAFALYSYLAADAQDPQIAAHAERLALEELRHAVVMRRWRREAWHRERRAMRQEAAGGAPADRPTPAPSGESLTSAGISAQSLRALLEETEAAIAARHRAIIAKLRTLGDDESARLLEELADSVPVRADAQTEPVPAGLASTDTPVHLLIAAQEPLEAFGERLEAIMPRMEGDRFTEAQNALESVISRISRISLQAERRMA